ncbi:MAG: ogt [Myxococcales bacterium]|nr:ogt [Myxococcales bacterium]
MTLAMLTMSCPLGDLRLYACDDELVGVYLPDQKPAFDAAASRSKILTAAADQLAEYFAGERTVFELALGARGTGFQERVWHALSGIPYGETCSYGSLASSIGRPSASRAVGAANAKNPISIIVPCHRVIAVSGELTGYAGGMPAKRWLLDHERRRATRQTSALCLSSTVC